MKCESLPYKTNDKKNKKDTHKKNPTHTQIKKIKSMTRKIAFIFFFSILYWRF